MEKKLFTFEEAQDFGTKLVEKRSRELKKELKEIRTKNSSVKELSYV